MAKITQIEILLVDLKPKVVRTDAIQSFTSQETPIVSVRDADGAVGIGYTYSIGTGGKAILCMLEDHLGPALLGQEAEAIEGLWWRMKHSTHATTVGAITSLAMASLDIALWDLHCKKAGLPLYQRAGGMRTCAPLYSTEGGWLHVSPEALVEDALQVKERGFGGIKIKTGKPTLAEDMARLGAVREAVGDDFEVMTDFNQSQNLPEAIRRAAAFETLNIAWVEEPMLADNIVAHRQLREAVRIPIAVGESLYSVGQFGDYARLGAASILQVDVARIGGITPWLKVAHLAECCGLPICPHFLMELHVSLVCAVANGQWVEYIPQLDSLTEEMIRIDRGFAYPSSQPGLGIAWSPEAIERQHVQGSKVVLKA